MTRLHLLLRTLRYFRWSNLAVIAGVAVATAILAGALMVGDSVRASLRELAERRLGPVDHALVATRFFPESLVERLRETATFKKDVAQATPAILLRGGAADEGGKVHTAGLQIGAVDQWITPQSNEVFINGQVAESLLLEATGKTILLKLPLVSDTPLDSTLARRDASEVTAGLRAKVARIVRGPDFASLFTLAPTQRTPANVWTNLRDLQRAIGQGRQVNAILVQAAGQPDFEKAMKQAVTLADYGLKFAKSIDGSEAVLNSTTTYISPAVQAAATHAARDLGIELRQVSVYLLNTLSTDRKGDITHYALAAGIDSLPGGSLADDQVALNEWTAAQLNAKVGEKLRFTFYQRQPNGDLAETEAGATFTLARILPMTGIGADRTLTPDYKGLTDADRFRDWEPPAGLKINKDLADEAYWDKYKAAPKVFLSAPAAQRLWGSAYGDLTSIRLPAGQREAFERKLLEHLEPADMGLTFMPIRQQHLLAAGGSTDFAGLFIGFSFFLIVAAALLVAMLFRLNIERRARQFGLLAAVGFTPGSLRRLALGEGLLLSTIGAIIGAGLGVGYTWLMIAGLRTWWVDAVGTTALQLHVNPITLIVGLVASILVALAVIAWTIWRLGRTQAAALMSGRLSGGMGSSPSPGTPGEGRGEGRLSGVRIGLKLVASPFPLLALALLCLLLGIIKIIPASAAFMSGGAMLLLASLFFAASRLRHVRRDADLSAFSVPALALRNAGRNRARSITTIALIAFATFILVTVASMKAGAPTDTHNPKSGTGGYQLIVNADLPLLGDPASPAGREVLNIDPGDAALPIWSRTTFTPLRLWAGQDISCLNLAKPTQPAILGVPQSLIESGRFTFASTLTTTDNPWKLLTQDHGGATPVIADSETAMWLLKLSVGDTWTITDQLGRPQTLILVGTLSHSIFQGELLMADRHFQRLFPTTSGFGTMLISAADADLPELRRILSTNLTDFSISIESTADRLARYQEVANTYLSTFQTLGSLGLLLGTVGLAIVLLRNLSDRRSELALLAALGFARPRRLRLVLTENAMLLLAGLFAGAASALIAILPALGERPINIPQLALTLAAVLLTGLLSLILATVLSPQPGAAALRAE